MKHAVKTSYGSLCVLIFLCFCVIMVLCSTVPAWAKVLPKTAKLVPPETVFLVEVDNFSELTKQFEKTNFYKLYKDPAMAGFVNDFRSNWREKMQQLNNEVARAIIDANALPQGRVAIALVQASQATDANQPPFLFVTQWGENITKIKEAVNKMVERAIQEGAARMTESYRGIIIETIRPALSPEGPSVTPEADSGEPFPTFSYCFFDDCLIGSMNLDVLKFVIAHIKGATSPTLADDSDYTITMKTIGPYHDIDFYVNIKQLIKKALSQDATNKTQTMITNLGLDNVVSLGCSIGVARRPGSSYCGRVLLKIEGEKKGICKMLDFESDVLRVARFIPASAHSVMFLNLSIKKIYEELYNILYSINPVTAAAMQVPLLPPGPEGEVRLELKSDVIDHLGAQIIIVQSTKKPFATGSAPAETLIALSINNRSSLEKSLSLWHSEMILKLNPDAKRELLGHTIYLLTPSALPFFRPGPTPMQGPSEMGAEQMPNLAFTITDTHLILGFESTVEQAIRTLSSPEAESVDSAQWFASAKLTIPSVVGMASLEDSAASSEIFWWMIKQTSKDKKSGACPGFAEMAMFGPIALSDLFNFNLLPDFDAVRKYFGSYVFYGISRPDGFFFEFNYLNPRGEQ